METPQRSRRTARCYRPSLAMAYEVRSPGPPAAAAGKVAHRAASSSAGRQARCLFPAESPTGSRAPGEACHGRHSRRP
jgi:hypothetical protein